MTFKNEEAARNYFMKRIYNEKTALKDFNNYVKSNYGADAAKIVAQDEKEYYGMFGKWVNECYEAWVYNNEIEWME